MKNKQFDTPILLIAFNRPETTCHVFEQIRKIKPSKLYIFLDAPRNEFESDIDLVETCKVLLDDSQINWPCKVQRWLADDNLGQAIGISSAITWAFESTERLIILEDDCLPNLSFFEFCQTMLTKYENNERIMHISGTCYQNGGLSGDENHFYSMVNHIWGWATWKRAWNKYDFWMEQFPEMKRSKKIQQIFGNAAIGKYWHDRFDQVYNETKKRSWDDQWQYTLFENYGLAVVPNVNLISNIGIQSRSDGLPAAFHFTETKSWRNENTHAQLIQEKRYYAHFTHVMGVENPSVIVKTFLRFLTFLRIRMAKSVFR